MVLLHFANLNCVVVHALHRCVHETAEWQPSVPALPIHCSANWHHMQGAAILNVVDTTPGEDLSGAFPLLKQES